MIKEYSLDMKSSIEIHSKYKSEIRAKECYFNVFHIVTNEMYRFQNGEWSVAYGYWTVGRNLLARHCFILTRNGKVIDPTLPCLESKLKESEHPYYIFKTMSIEEYDSYLAKANYKPCMGDLFFNLEKKVEKHLMSNNIFIIDSIRAEQFKCK